MENVTEIPRVNPVTNFVRRHKTAIAVTATAAICLTLNRIALAQHEAFLKERGLYDEFYNPEDE